jgi:hypothetical protein
MIAPAIAQWVRYSRPRVKMCLSRLSEAPPCIQASPHKPLSPSARIVKPLAKGLTAPDYVLNSRLPVAAAQAQEPASYWLELDLGKGMKSALSGSSQTRLLSLMGLSRHSHSAPARTFVGCCLPYNDQIADVPQTQLCAHEATSAPRQLNDAAAKGRRPIAQLCVGVSPLR